MMNMIISIMLCNALFFCATASAVNCTELSHIFETRFINEITKENLKDMEECSDNPYSTYYLGWAYSQKEYKYFNSSKAELYLLESSKLGSIAAKMELAESYLLGIFTRVDHKQASLLAKKIIDTSSNTNNILFAKYILSYISIVNSSEESFDDRDYENLLLAAKAGYKGASDLLLTLAFNEKISSKGDKLSALRLASSNGNQDAKFSLASMLYKEKKAEGLYSMFELANDGYLQAQIFLVNYFDEKNSDASMLYWMKAAADNGSALMAYYYSNRINAAGSRRLTEVDDSIRYLTFAAESGVNDAYKAIGDYYIFFYCETKEKIFYDLALRNYKKVEDDVNGKVRRQIDYCLD